MCCLKRLLLYNALEAQLSSPVSGQSKKRKTRGKKGRRREEKEQKIKLTLLRLIWPDNVGVSSKGIFCNTLSRRRRRQKKRLGRSSMVLVISSVYAKKKKVDKKNANDATQFLGPAKLDDGKTRVVLSEFL